MKWNGYNINNPDCTKYISINNDLNVQEESPEKEFYEQIHESFPISFAKLCNKNSK